MFRASFPSIFGSFRILYDIGWTYVILAEMVNARKGVGYMVEAARKVLDFERVYAGIIAIGFAAFLFRFLLTFLERLLFPWRRRFGTRPRNRLPLWPAGAPVKAPRACRTKLRSAFTTSPAALSMLQGKSRRCAARHQLRSGGRFLAGRPRYRRVPRSAGALRLRQIHPAAHHRRPRPARQRREYW